MENTCSTASLTNGNPQHVDLYDTPDLVNDDEEMQIRSFDKKGRIKAKIKRMGIIFGISFFGLLALGISLGLALRSTDSNNTERNGGGDVSTTALPPPPPPNLDKICSIDQITSSPSEYEKCVTTCRDAECCFTSDPDLSCIRSGLSSLSSHHESICTSYDIPCRKVRNPQFVPPAPTNIYELCREEVLREENNLDGFIVCQDVCDVAKCCFTGHEYLERDKFTSMMGEEEEEEVPNCVLTNDVTCLQYNICAHVPASQEDFPPLTRDSEEEGETTDLPADLIFDGQNTSGSADIQALCHEAHLWRKSNDARNSSSSIHDDNTASITVIDHFNQNSNITNSTASIIEKCNKACVPYQECCIIQNFTSGIGSTHSNLTESNNKSSIIISADHNLTSNCQRIDCGYYSAACNILYEDISAQYLDDENNTYPELPTPSPIRPTTDIIDNSNYNNSSDNDSNKDVDKDINDKDEDISNQVLSSDLDEICNPGIIQPSEGSEIDDDIMSNFPALEKCRNKCAVAQCCFDNDESCEIECVGFASCKILYPQYQQQSYDNDESISKEGVSEEEGSNTKLSAYLYSMCDAYTIQNDLSEALAVTSNSSSNDDISQEDKNTEANDGGVDDDEGGGDIQIQSDTYKQCNEACAIAKCCFGSTNNNISDSISTNSTSKQNSDYDEKNCPVNCYDYKACEVIYEYPGFINTEASVINASDSNAAASVASNNTTNETILNDDNIIEESYSDDNDNSNDNSGIIKNNDDFDEGEDIIANELEEFCDNRLIQVSAISYQTCIKKCQPGVCCFKSSSNTATNIPNSENGSDDKVNFIDNDECMDKKACESYAICSFIAEIDDFYDANNDDFTSTPDQVPTSNSNENNEKGKIEADNSQLLLLTSDIGLQCSSSLSSENMLENYICENICRERKCCNNLSCEVIDNNDNAPTGYCEDFDICRNVLDLVEEEKKTENMDNGDDDEEESEDQQNEEEGEDVQSVEAAA
eukprot:CAMPEP_0194425578 /NCGR_PEP_ID=MMETSP0176-20130528/24833_1 /TAXON_ID=216777 /ORGANISM="Proboscia alata, Strain PI-D3" /LENGTH=988 /DNA_ID=CAMNT_0039235945 /DNA_START=1365 /DNA_END=4327 /DNA_ORIENTATION=+